MPITRSDGGLPGPARSELWDVALGQLARHSRVELDEVVAELDADASPDDVRRAIEEGLVRMDWLRRPDDRRDVWLPDVRAYALMDLTRRDAPTREPAPEPTSAATIARTVA